MFLTWIKCLITVNNIGDFVYKARGEKITNRVISIALKARVTPGHSGSCVVGRFSLWSSSFWYQSNWMASSRYEWDVLGFPCLSGDSFRSDLQVWWNFLQEPAVPLLWDVIFDFFLLWFSFFLHGMKPDMMKIPMSSSFFFR